MEHLQCDTVRLLCCVALAWELLRVWCPEVSIALAAALLLIASVLLGGVALGPLGLLAGGFVGTVAAVHAAARAPTLLIHAATLASAAVPFVLDSLARVVP
jgi:hypothetical protein